jgi:putative MATE family efflux protein
MSITALRNYYLGDRSFFHTVIKVALPLVITQLITTFVNILDNIMVGQTGTLAMSGVSIANQLITVFSLAVFGSISGASIFGAQFYGSGDDESMRCCLRFKFILEGLLSLAVITVFMLSGRQLVGLFLNPGTNLPEEIQATMNYALSYIHIMCFGFVPFAFSNCISSSFREAGETRIPMIASVSAVAINFIGNYLLIFGSFGFPRLGADGAAIATVISRLVELAILIMAAWHYRFTFSFFRNIFHPFRIPSTLAKDMIRKGTPLTINEILWSAGLAAIAQCYARRGINAIAAYNIASTVENLFFVFNYAMGDTISILVGQKLGAGKIEEAVDTDRRLISYTLIISIIIGLLLFSTASLFPQLYNTEEEIRQTAARLLRVSGLCMWISSLYNTAYFTMRCGGKTVLTFLFDSVGTVCISFPIAWCLSHLTALSVVAMYAVIHIVDVYKVILGLILIHKRIWVNRLSQPYKNPDR